MVFSGLVGVIGTSEYLCDVGNNARITQSVCHDLSVKSGEVT